MIALSMTEELETEADRVMRNSEFTHFQFTWWFYKKPWEILTPIVFWCTLSSHLSLSITIQASLLVLRWSQTARPLRANKTSRTARPNTPVDLLTATALEDSETALWPPSQLVRPHRTARRCTMLPGAAWRASWMRVRHRLPTVNQRLDLWPHL